MRALKIAVGMAALVAAPLAAQSLAGVSDKETTIPFAGDEGIRDYHFGKGDVMFIRDRTNRWYRIALNDGCLSGTHYGAVSFKVGPDGRLDRFSKVRFGPYKSTCLINSIRESEAPPQVDSTSPVTLD